MRTIVGDIESDSLDPSVVWCNVAKEDGTNTHLVWDIVSGHESFIDYAKTVDRFVYHNGISFDVPVINELIGDCIPFDKVVDTFVVSRLVNYPNYKGHGLDEIGLSLGQPKTHFNDFSKYTQKMLDYCKDDVDLGMKIYKHYQKYIDDPQWQKSMECEHKTAQLCKEMRDNGFKFDIDLANKLLPQIQEERAALEARMQEAWPPQLQPVHEIQYRLKQDGSLYKTVEYAMKNYPKTTIEGDKLICWDWVSFNPGSTKDRVEKLWEAGWNPTEKSDGHYKFSMKAQVGEPWGKTILTQEAYNEKKEYFEFYGWKVTEENLETLPEDAPQTARDLTEWLCLNGRLKALEERIREYNPETGRVHTTFWHIGAWTHRMSHSNPNLANVSSPFHGTPRNAVEEVKKRYDGDFRRMFCVDEGSLLLGTDAESIQLRVLAHYLQNEAYVKAIVSGKKEDETDIHNLNRRALGLNHATRDDAKTFVYAWLLGAGNSKVSRILRCSTTLAKRAVESFVESTEGLGKLKRGRIRHDASRGYFEGLDGRLVMNDSEYLMLAGYLQNGEAVIMKHWANTWIPEARSQGINFKVVNFVHDEIQTEVVGDEAECRRLEGIQADAMNWVANDLGLFCPLGIESKIGSNWLETH